MDSILQSVRVACNLPANYDAFDNQLIMLANGVFMTLDSMGITPYRGFAIVDETDAWSTFSSDPMVLNGVTDYVGTKVRLKFDPPANATIFQALQEHVKELEWRLMERTQPYYKEVSNDERL